MNPKIKRTVAYLSLAVVILYIITGYGITKYQTVEKLTFGTLTKALSFKIHEKLIYPLIILLLAHIVLALNLIERFNRQEENNISKKI
jgi:hypothetical protein